MYNINILREDLQHITKHQKFQFNSKKNFPSNSKNSNPSIEQKKRSDSFGSNVSSGDNYVKGNALYSFPSKNHRYIALDTETTGLSSLTEHLVSINAVEIINAELTGIQYHAYINPRHKQNDPNPNNGFTYYMEDYANEREDNALKSLKDFIRFVDGCPIITHNAKFDIKFINKELRRFNLEEIDLTKCICTLKISKWRKGKHFYEQKSSLKLKSLCQRYGIFIREQDYHHGIVDAVALGRLICKMWNDNEEIINLDYIVSQCEKEYKNNNKNNLVQSKQNANSKQGNYEVKGAIRKLNKEPEYNKFDLVKDEEEKIFENYAVNVGKIKWNGEKCERNFNDIKDKEDKKFMKEQNNEVIGDKGKVNEYNEKGKVKSGGGYERYYEKSVVIDESNQIKKRYELRDLIRKDYNEERIFNKVFGDENEDNYEIKKKEDTSGIINEGRKKGEEKKKEIKKSIKETLKNLLHKQNK